MPSQLQTGQLPVACVIPSRPFSVSGIDYVSHVYLRPVHMRAATATAFLCMSVYFVTKAVHIELVSDLLTKAFLRALRRFITLVNSNSVCLQ